MCDSELWRPQGCVLSPILFVLYTNDLCWNSENVIIQKYADDTIILGLIENDCDNEYQQCIDFVNKWCIENYLSLNASKTKELLWDFRKISPSIEPIQISGTVVERVNTYKYLGLVVDNKLSFIQHVESQIKKANRRIYCIRAMRKLSVDPNIIVTFYNACIPPLLMYAGTAYFGMLTKRLKHDLNKPRRLCRRILGQPRGTLAENDILYLRNVNRLANVIAKDASHPLYREYALLPSGRRYRSCYARTVRFRNTFVPHSIRLLNDSGSI